MKQDEMRIVKMPRKMLIEGKLDHKRKRSVKKGYQVGNDENIKKRSTTMCTCLVVESVSYFIRRGQ